MCLLPAALGPRPRCASLLPAAVQGLLQLLCLAACACLPARLPWAVTGHLSLLPQLQLHHILHPCCSRHDPTHQPSPALTQLPLAPAQQQPTRDVMAQPADSCLPASLCPCRAELHRSAYVSSVYRLGSQLGTGGGGRWEQQALMLLMLLMLLLLLI